MLIRLSDSFRATVAQVAAEAGAELLEWVPAEGEVPSAGAAATILLAGGEEGAALDLVPRLAAAGPRVFLVGAALDHRLAVGAIQAGAATTSPCRMTWICSAARSSGRSATAAVEMRPNASPKQSGATWGSERSWAEARRCAGRSNRRSGWRRTAT